MSFLRKRESSQVGRVPRRFDEKPDTHSFAAHCPVTPAKAGDQSIAAITISAHQLHAFGGRHFYSLEHSTLMDTGSHNRRYLTYRVAWVLASARMTYS